MSACVYRLGISLALVAVALATTSAALESRAPGPTRANVRRIRAGMSRAEVERVLAGPGEIEGSELDGEWLSRVHAWHGPEGAVYVYLGHRRDSSGAEERRGVVRRVAFSSRTDPASPLSRIRCWFSRCGRGR